jgi:methionyl-tRNA formyltransferase
MRVGFAGTPAFAARALAAVHANGFTIPVVLTQPDRPFGRGLALAASPVKRYAADHALPLLQPPSLKCDTVQAALRDIPIDVLVVAAYGLILPQPVLDWPRHGCLNVHASLLPRWRGAAPVARAVEAGDAVSGITIMQMDAGLDTGAIVTAQALELGARETTGTLTDRLAIVGASMIVDALCALERDGRLPAMPQPVDGATYAAKICRADTLIDWTQDAEAVDRRVRALAPSPGALAGWRGKPVKVHAAVPVEAKVAANAGMVVAVGAYGIDVACGTGALRLTHLQPAAGRSMPAQAFAAGHHVAAGERFEPGRQSVGAALPD